MTKCLIVEDEPLAQRVLVDYIQQTPGLQLMHTCASALEALPLVSRVGIDLLFLDLQLPGLSGPAFIQALPQPPAFICTTAYPEYAAASYDWGAIDYLLKPIAYTRFAQSLAKYWQQTGAVIPPAPHTYFKVNGRLLKLLHTDLVCAQSVNDYLVLRTRSGGSHLTNMTLKYLLETLASPLFQRVHRSFVINTTHITALTRHVVELGPVKISLGEHYKHALGALWDEVP
jgi:two-component system LytT family response regulator